MKQKRIFIVGHLGAGKALLGKALAVKLGWKFVDANLSLERNVGRGLNEIIGKQGEEKFQELQGEILSHYLKIENVVVSTDDIIINSEKNRKLLKNEFVIYLKVNSAQQIERMSYGPAPLLPISDLKGFFDKLHRERDVLFDQISKLTIDSESVEADVDTILKEIEK
ncbi:MAG: shikimate kinase [Gammaproteobacteria bacterium]